MKRIFLIHPSPVHVEMVPELMKLGIEIDLVFRILVEQDDPFRKMLPNAVFPVGEHVSRGNLKEALDQEFFPPTKSDLDSLAPWEGMTLQMLEERYNVDNRVNFSHLRFVYYRLISFWKTMLKEYQPDAVVFTFNPHRAADYVLYLLCQQQGIPTRMLELTYFDERMIIRNTIEDVPNPTVSELDEALKEGVVEASLTSEKRENYDKVWNNLQRISQQLSWSTIFRSMLQPGRILAKLGLRKSNDRPIIRLTSTLHSTWLTNFVAGLSLIQVRKAFHFYNQHTKVMEKSEPYVYFPLHMQPEKSTLPDGGRFLEQMLVVDTVSAALPPGWKLYVKEHPSQFNRSMLWPLSRTHVFYQELVANSRVELAPLDLPVSELIDNCQAVVTLTGTTGWEAVQKGKPALVFGYPWYLNCPGVYSVDSVAACAEIFSAIGSGQLEVNPKTTEAFANVLRAKYTFRGCSCTHHLPYVSITIKENGKLLAEAVAKSILGPDCSTTFSNVKVDASSSSRAT